MKYITRCKNGVKVISKNREILNYGLIEYINMLCLNELSTYKGRITSTKKTLGIISNIPVYVNNNIMLFPTRMIRDYDCVFVNYTQVLSVKKQGDSTLIVFDDLTEISIPTSINKVKIQIKKCKLINNFVKDNIFV